MQGGKGKTSEINRFLVFMKMADLVGSWPDISAWILAQYWQSDSFVSASASDTVLDYYNDDLLGQ